MPKTRICPICEAENSSEYEYCKECGAILPAVDTGTTKNLVADNTATNAMGEDAGAKKYCGACGACAQAADRFCNKCGTRFADIKQEPFNIPNDGRTTQSSANNYSYNGYYTYASADDSTIFGIDENDMREFVGQNNEGYINRFKKMSQSGSKASWNWPVFLFSFLLNIPFVWFFYKKMYKVGSILLAVCVALNVISLSIVMNMMSPFFDIVSDMVNESIAYSEEYYDDYYDYSDEYFDEYYNDYANEYEDEIYGIVKEIIMSSMIMWLVSIVKIVLSVVLAIFANRMYLNHCVRKICQLSGVADEQYRSVLLSQTGGNSTGLAVGVGIGVPVLMFIVNFVFLMMQFTSAMF